MNNVKRMKTLKIVISSIIVILVLGLLVIYPLIDFKQKEDKLTEAGKRYFEINSNLLPTGDRIKTVSLKELYQKNFLNTLFQVYSKNNMCSIEDSFVKVKKVDGQYKYYTYLKCGIMSSLTDHKGPEITLNGQKEMSIEKGTAYNEPGVKNVVDNSDGKIAVKEVAISGKVDKDKVGNYEIKYSVSDSLGNKTTIVRTVKVIETLSKTVEAAASDSGYYQGNTPNNYIKFSNMLYRIINVDKNGNVRIIADDDVAMVDYSGLEKWMNDYYYEHLNADSKKYLVDTKYCTDKVKESDLYNATDCKNYTTKKVGQLSIIDINNSKTEDATYLYGNTMVWLANTKSDKQAWTTRSFYVGKESNVRFMEFNLSEPMAAKPVLTLKKGIKIVSGDGTSDNPYTISDTKKASIGDNINTRNTGEYVESNGTLYRIIETTDKGLTKVISEEVTTNNGELVEIGYPTTTEKVTYNPEKSSNVGYKINNEITKYIETSHFVNNEITVPIYKTKAKYGKEESTKKYKVKLSAPNMFEMFSGLSSTYGNKSYWLINSSQEEGMIYRMDDIGNINGKNDIIGQNANVRVVGYINKNCTIVKGSGTISNPYVITK